MPLAVRSLRAALALGSVLALLGVAHADAVAAPRPFGHDCTPLSGVRFCPTRDDSERVPSFDGVPLDVDVTLPPSGDGPFPTIVMLHGWGGSKAMFESASANSAYSNVALASRGYAVVNYSARGWGRSCGVPASRTAGCERGWTHLADQRYEIRDTQYLLGLLVDEGIADPRALGATGVSYGGIQSLELAFLRDRVRLRNGKLVRWRSPKGRLLTLRAAWARWGTADLAGSLTLNGRISDARRARVGASWEPLGIPKQSYINGLYSLAAISAYLAPPGADATADLTTWKAITDAARETPAARSLVRELTRYHGAAGVADRRRAVAPLLIQNGWTDDLFPAIDGVYAYRLAGSGRRGFVALQIGDLGHPRAQTRLSEEGVFLRQGLAFFDRFLRGRRGGPGNGAVTAFLQSCPESTPSRPLRARSWDSLARGRLILASRASGTVTSDGGDPTVGRTIDPIGGGGACAAVTPTKAPGTLVLERRVRRTTVVAGLPTISMRVRASAGRAYVVARLWFVGRDGKMRLIGRGAVRLRAKQRGAVRFQLLGTGWRLAAGDRVRLELLGRDAPYLRPNDEEGFKVRVSRVRALLPVVGR